jgi:hypothetical protein
MPTFGGLAALLGHIIRRDKMNDLDPRELERVQGGNGAFDLSFSAEASSTGEVMVTVTFTIHF